MIKNKLKKLKNAHPGTWKKAKFGLKVIAITYLIGIIALVVINMNTPEKKFERIQDSIKYPGIELEETIVEIKDELWDEFKSHNPNCSIKTAIAWNDNGLNVWALLQDNSTGKYRLEQYYYETPIFGMLDTNYSSFLNEIDFQFYISPSGNLELKNEISIWENVKKLPIV